MTNGGIEANGLVRSVAISATSGSPVSFLTTNTLRKAPAQIFCAVVCNSVNVARVVLTIFPSQATIYPASILQVLFTFSPSTLSLTTFRDSQYPYLTVHEHFDKWFLCAKVYRPDLITWRVVYDANPGVPSRDYVVDTCYSVLLNIVT